MAQAVKSVRYHLAQVTFRVGEEAEFPAIIAGDFEQKKHFADWIGFQLAYQDARSRGLTDVQSHAFGAHGGEFVPEWCKRELGASGRAA